MMKGFPQAGHLKYESVIEDQTKPTNHAIKKNGTAAEATKAEASTAK
jgi:hypothetical protein